MTAENSDAANMPVPRRPAPAPADPATAEKSSLRGLGGMLKRFAAPAVAVGQAAQDTGPAEDEAGAAAKADETDAGDAPAAPPEILSLLETLSINQQLLDEEYDRLKAGDFSHTDLYACRKRKAVAYLERLLTRAEPLMADLDPKLSDEVHGRVAGFKHSLESNLRLIDSTRQAIAQILAQTLKLVEKQGGDGVYTKAGEKLTSEQFSATGVTAKL